MRPGAAAGPALPSLKAQAFACCVVDWLNRNPHGPRSVAAWAAALAVANMMSLTASGSLASSKAARTRVRCSLRTLLQRNPNAPIAGQNAPISRPVQQIGRVLYRRDSCRHAATAEDIEQYSSEFLGRITTSCLALHRGSRMPSLDRLYSPRSPFGSRRSSTFLPSSSILRSNCFLPLQLPSDANKGLSPHAPHKFALGAGPVTLPRGETVAIYSDHAQTIYLADGQTGRSPADLCPGT